MKLVDLGIDVVHLICEHLDCVSVVQLLATAKPIWNQRFNAKLRLRIDTYKKYITEETWDHGMLEAVRYHDIPHLNYFLEKGKSIFSKVWRDPFDDSDENDVEECDNHYWNLGMLAAASKGHLDLVEFFENKGADDWAGSIRVAASIGNTELVNYFISKGDYWNQVLEGASFGGHQNLIDLSINNGADDFGSAVSSAARGGQKHLVEFFAPKSNYSNWWKELEGAAYSGNMDLIEYIMVELKHEDLEDGARGSGEGGHKDVVQFFLDKGASVRSVLVGAIQGGQLDIVKEYLKDDMLEDVDVFLHEAIIFDSLDIVKFLVEQGAEAGSDALEQAIRSRHIHIMKYLESKGAKISFIPLA